VNSITSHLAGLMNKTHHTRSATMNTPANNDPATSPPMRQEADIGSGEITPAQKETEEMIRQIPPLPENQSKAPNQPNESNQTNASNQPNQSSEPSDQPGIVSPS
jgi:hypothetical protein